jgi:hypothetical protein
MTDYKATPKQWEQVLSWSEDRDVSVSCDAACILELRARIEALEAKNKPGFMELSATTTTAPVCRPKPPSLKEQALNGLEKVESFTLGQLEGVSVFDEYKTHVDNIRRALEQLDD